MSEFSSEQILTEAQVIYDAVCDSAMENGRDLPWWSELDEGVVQTYLEQAKRKLERKAKAAEVLSTLRVSDIVEWLQDKGYDVYQYE
ncbi:Uncharacterised protein [Enterobacter hormaechei]|nr:hypothetical protein [Enterobacter asburiae]CZV06166.1 Uncharacterised protein [Enterobacter hormaechei]HAS1003051.1 hypothetical protein [Enterobacter cloacae]CZV47147.1 Uncharacterised protein [Enterobacter hormaechei]CZV76787.1 Uncharacterised protein [Enterobacter hormaechei]CZW11355.1 Uncharacterised protein [Enterobacter hormaechei]